MEKKSSAFLPATNACCCERGKKRNGQGWKPCPPARPRARPCIFMLHCPRLDSSVQTLRVCPSACAPSHRFHSRPLSPTLASLPYPDVNKAFLTGEAKYMSTGRGFVIVHDRFLGQYCRYLQSHFVPAFEMMLLLIVSDPACLAWRLPSRSRWIVPLGHAPLSTFALVRFRLCWRCIKPFDRA